MRKDRIKEFIILTVAVLVLCVGLAGNTTAKSLYVNRDLNLNSPIRAYDIQGNGNLAFQMDSNPTKYGGAGLAIDTDSKILFVTFESSGTLDIVDATTLKLLGQVNAPGANNLAGIVVDQDKSKLYTVNRGDTKVYVYDWDSDMLELTLEGTKDLSGSNQAYGLALDEVNDLLYLGDLSNQIKVYSTDNWVLIKQIPVSQVPMSVAVDVSRGYVYSGNALPYYGCTGELVQYNLANDVENTLDIRSLNGGVSSDCVVGVAVDPLTGYVYITTGNMGAGGSDRILTFNSDLQLLSATDDIGDPTGIVVPGKDISFNPLGLTKNDGLNDATECVSAADNITYTISYDSSKNTVDVTNASITDTLPADVTFVSCTDGCNPSGNVLTWNLGTISAGATGYVELVAQVNSGVAPGSVIHNDATINSDQTPPTTQGDDTNICTNQPPVARCKDTTLNLDSNGQAVLSPSQVDDGSYDPDEDPITFDLSRTNFTCADIGTKHTVTLTVTDDGGLSDTCVSKVTVIDNLPPVPDTVSLSPVKEQCSAKIPAAPTATDNCAGTVTGTTSDPLSYSEQGTYTVTWTFNDGNGNTSTQPQQVVVQDTVAPTVVTKSITVELDENGNASISVDDIDNGSTDNCCIASRTIDKSSFTCSDAGENTTVTLTVKDCNGNSNSATAIVTVEDNIAPVVKTKNITVELDADGNASITADDIDNGSSDNCGIASLALDRTEFTCSDLDGNTVTLTVTDNNGNVADETATVTVLPYTVPVSTTGVITDKPTSSYRDVAIFKITGVTDIGTVAMDAAAAGTAVTFEFRTADKGRLYSFTADSFDAAGNRMIYSDTEGNMVRCIFSTERCVVRMRYVDFDGDALDASLPGDMTVNLQVGCTQYSNTGYWQQYDSGSGTWTKYRKDS